MHYSQFTKKLSGIDVVESVRSYGTLIQKTADNKIFVGEELSDFATIEEARTYIKNKQYSDTLEQEISKEIYQNISENRIANIIKEHHNIKVTDTLIESYIELASSKMFTVDPVVQKIRSLNNLDFVVENKIHYVLNDGCVVAINDSTQEELNNLLQNNKEIVEYMRESKNNFLYVLSKIKE